MSFQPEERYWTDYLRIALPVIGLLILIALLWYWASALIGGPSDAPPTAGLTPFTETVPSEVAPATPHPSPTPTAPAITPTPGAAPTATVPAAVNPTVSAEPTQAAEGEVPAGGNTNPDCQNRDDYGAGATVVTSSDVNLRTAPSTGEDSSVISLIPAGTQLQTTGAFVDQPDCDWWPVQDPVSGQQGFVREDFLQPVSQ